MKSLILLMLLSVSGHAQDNCVHLRGGVSLDMPAEPSDPEAQAAFAKLKPEQRLVFYQRRDFLVRKLVGGLAYPRALGGIAWAKRQAGWVISKLKGTEVAEAPDLPLKDEGQRILQTIAQVFTDKLWSDAEYIAGANSVGFTIYVGPVVNTSLAKWGFFWGRGISLDIGHDFAKERGYVRIYADQQKLKRPGLSLDIGVMTDFLVHFNSLPSDDANLSATHYKLPMIGCYRHGENYRAYGLQVGVHALEFVAMAIAYRHPEIAAGLVLGTRLLGSATIYSTSLTRNFLWKFSVPTNRLPRALIYERVCEAALLPAPTAPPPTNEDRAP